MVTHINTSTIHRIETYSIELTINSKKMLAH